jgi:hypothetical protein
MDALAKSGVRAASFTFRTKMLWAWQYSRMSWLHDAYCFSRLLACVCNLQHAFPGRRRLSQSVPAGSAQRARARARAVGPHVKNGGQLYSAGNRNDGSGSGAAMGPARGRAGGEGGGGGAPRGGPQRIRWERRYAGYVRPLLPLFSLLRGTLQPPPGLPWCCCGGWHVWPGGRAGRGARGAGRGARRGASEPQSIALGANRDSA